MSFTCVTQRLVGHTATASLHVFKNISTFRLDRDYTRPKCVVLEIFIIYIIFFFEIRYVVSYYKNGKRIGVCEDFIRFKIRSPEVSGIGARLYSIAVCLKLSRVLCSTRVRN